MDRYTFINSLFRTTVNNNPFQYRGVDMPVYYTSDPETDTGAYVHCRLFTNQPITEEIGYGSGQNVTGYYQIDGRLPAADRGLDYELNNFASQISNLFPVSRLEDSNISIQIDSVERLSPIRIDGHFVVGCRVYYRVWSCVEV